MSVRLALHVSVRLALFVLVFVVCTVLLITVAVFGAICALAYRNCRADFSYFASGNDKAVGQPTAMLSS